MWCGAQQTETGLWEGSAGMEDGKDKETDANKHDKEMPQFETEMNKGLEKTDLGAQNQRQYRTRQGDFWREKNGKTCVDLWVRIRINGEERQT